MKKQRRKFAHIPIPVEPDRDAQVWGRLEHRGDYSTESFRDRVMAGRGPVTTPEERAAAKAYLKANPRIARLCRKIRNSVKATA